jgi:hypothetical protein
MDRDCDEFDNGVLDASCAGGFTITGALDLAWVPPQPNTGLAVARCDVQVIDPISIPAIGVVCIAPERPAGA